MFPYVVIFWFWAVLAYLTRKRRHSMVLATVFAMFLVLFVGARGEVGCDYRAYAQRYATLYQDMGWQEAMLAGEGGFHWLNMALLSLGQSFSMSLLACGAIFAACAWRLSREVERPLSFLVLAFPVLFVQLAMSGLRQALATALLMLAMAAFMRRKRLLVAAWICIAALFHTSVIVFLPLALLVGRHVSTLRMAVVLLAMSPLIAFFLGERLATYSNRYVVQIYGEQDSNGAWFRYALVLVPALVLLWKRRLVEAAFPRQFPLMRIFGLFTVALALVGALSSVALHRFVFYVMPMSIITLLAISEVIFRPGSRRFGAALPFVAYGLYITVWFGGSRHANLCYMPYETWLL